ncbi:MAG: spore germination protein [Eubacteriales bacterium]|nr:spore germination protein [Eubacteriales bacterium]
MKSEELLERLGRSEDVACAGVALAGCCAEILYIEGLVPAASVGTLLVEPMKREGAFSRCDARGFDVLVGSGQLYAPAPEECRSVREAVERLGRGHALVVGESGRCWGFDLAQPGARAVGPPEEENVAKGAKDSFVESLRANTATLRTRIRGGDLRFERLTVGARTRTAVDIVWCEGIADPDLRRRVREKVLSVRTDAVLTTGALEEAMFGRRLLPSMLYTERPDKLAADLLEGCVCLLVDGLPFGFILPATLLRCMQAPEDYADLPVMGSLLRVLRFVCLVVTLLLPAFYTAMAIHNPEMIPRKLAVSIEAAKVGVPFTTLEEILIMLVAFEVLFEAGLRLPKNFGSAVSIVGAVVVGQATVTAKIISPVIVVLIAFTAMAGYTIPNQDLANAVRLWRAVFVVTAALLGLTGVFLGFMLLLSCLCRAETLGVNFLSPFTAAGVYRGRDAMVRDLMGRQRYRPDELKPVDEVRR